MIFTKAGSLCRGVTEVSLSLVRMNVERDTSDGSAGDGEVLQVLKSSWRTFLVSYYVYSI